jgi:glutamate-5-semialdehyde dehydrogenase
MNVVAPTDVQSLMTDIGKRARAAGAVLAVAPTEAKNAALRAAAQAIRVRAAKIKAINAKEMEDAGGEGMSSAMLDRLQLNDKRIEGMAKSLEEIADLPDPVGTEIARWSRPNGLDIARVRTPLGVVGIIYESRPNVTADAGGLCLKAGNAAILRGGKESLGSSAEIVACLHEGLRSAGLPVDALQMIPTSDRAAVGVMLRMNEYIDVIVPRGGKGLIERVIAESRIPLFQHLEGNCHTYIDGAADLAMARTVLINAKMRRTGVCGATETLLVDKRVGNSHLPVLVKDLLDAGCEVRGDEATRAVDARVKPVTEDDYYTEYLDAIIAVKVVADLGEAMAHIAKYGSHHTEAIITGDDATAVRFLNEVDSAIVLHNASTQFADGGEFGMGAEIGISTGRLHARGPVGVEQLTIFKYVVRGAGQVRP